MPFIAPPPPATTATAHPVVLAQVANAQPHSDTVVALDARTLRRTGPGIALRGQTGLDDDAETSPDGTRFLQSSQRFEDSGATTVAYLNVLRARPLRRVSVTTLRTKDDLETYAWLRPDRILALATAAGQQEAIAVFVVDPGRTRPLRRVTVPGRFEAAGRTGEREVLITSPSRPVGAPAGPLSLVVLDADGAVARTVVLDGVPADNGAELSFDPSTGHALVLSVSGGTIADVDLDTGAVQPHALPGPLDGAPRAVYEFKGELVVGVSGTSVPGNTTGTKGQSVQFLTPGTLAVRKVRRVSDATYGIADAGGGRVALDAGRRIKVLDADGTVAWQSPTRAVVGATVGIGGVVYSTSAPQRGGDLVALSARTGKLLGRTRVRLTLQSPTLGGLGGASLSDFETEDDE